MTYVYVLSFVLVIRCGIPLVIGIRRMQREIKLKDKLIAEFCEQLGFVTAKMALYEQLLDRFGIAIDEKSEENYYDTVLPKVKQ